LTLDTCTISNNTATGKGAGGVFAVQYTAIGCTITDQIVPA
jgi:hypothetical protein